jgi:hypothetical protein
LLSKVIDLAKRLSDSFRLWRTALPYLGFRHLRFVNHAGPKDFIGFDNLGGPSTMPRSHMITAAVVFSLVVSTMMLTTLGSAATASLIEAFRL